MNYISLTIIALAIYLVVGFLFAIAFIAKGARSIDEVAISTPLSVRLLLIPGSVLLWPKLLLIWVRK